MRQSSGQRYRQGYDASASRDLMLAGLQAEAFRSQLHEQEPEMFSGVNLSRNRGHQNALLAGLLVARWMGGLGEPVATTSKG